MKRIKFINFPAGITLIEGKSGSGKTTLIKEIRTDDSVVMKQGLQPLENITVSSFIKKYTSVTPTSKHNKYFTDLKLEHISNSKIIDLSGGEFQRLHFWVSIVNAQVELILDEPVSFQDKRNRQLMTNIINDISQDIPKIVVITHQQLELILACKINVETSKFEIINSNNNKIEISSRLKEPKQIIKNFYKTSKPTFKSRKTIYSLIIAIMFILLFALISTPINKVVMNIYEKNNEKIYVTLSIDKANQDALKNNELSDVFYQIPLNGEEQTYFFTNEQIAGLTSTNTMASIYTMPTLVSIPSSASSAKNTCLYNFTTEQSAEIYNKYGIDNSLTTGTMCEFVMNYGLVVNDILYGSNQVSPNTNEAIIPYWLADLYFGDAANSVGQEITLSLNYFNPTTNEYQLVDYTFEVVGVTTTSEFIVYSAESFYLAAPKLNMYDDIKSYQMLSNQTGYAELDALSGQEIYEAVGTGVTTIYGYVYGGTSYSQFINYIEKNLPGAIIQDVNYKLQSGLISVFKSIIVAIILLIIVVGLIWLFLKQINKKESEYLEFEKVFLEDQNFKEIQGLYKKRDLKNIKNLLIITISLFTITTLFGQVNGVQGIYSNIISGNITEGVIAYFTINIITASLVSLLLLPIILTSFKTRPKGIKWK